MNQQIFGFKRGRRSGWRAPANSRREELGDVIHLFERDRADGFLQPLTTTMAAKKDPRRPLSSMSITIMSSRNTGLLACYAVACTISLLMDSTTAFVAPSSGLPSASRRRFDNFAPSSSRLDMMMMDATNAFQDAAMALSSSSSTMLLAETEPWVQPLALVLDPALNLLSFAMVRTYKICDGC
jgi:hypothetical protein